VLSSNNLIAAIDIGSNSIRLEIWRFDHNQYAKVEYHKEVVRLGLGLDGERNLTSPAMQRGWDCLARFGERLTHFAADQVTAVATQTLREAKNRDLFLERGVKLLGYPINVISGREEARLIYQGVANFLPRDDEPRLVIDIGGRSTELILGVSTQANTLESYRLGSASWSAKYFPDGKMTETTFDRAEVAAKATLDEAVQQYSKDYWRKAYGSSGTIGAFADVFMALEENHQFVTLKGLKQLKKLCIKAGHTDMLDLPGLKDERRPVIAGGLSVLLALFDLLAIEELHVTEGALRHGLLLELIERRTDSAMQGDVRSHTVERLQRTFGVDLAQAERINSVAQTLLKQLYPEPRNSQTQSQLALCSQRLSWAAGLHEMGSIVSHSDYHKHGAYILDNSDAIGFALPELHHLSQLVLGHRGKLRKLELDWNDAVLVNQLMALRLAVLLCHARSAPELAQLSLKLKNRSFVLHISATWAKRFPQSAYLLGIESVAWQKTGWTFDVIES
jgi:exopolyphosphatase / guanosine-5'-triphosphate,3'-diphosphate pyrophosphatase